MRMLSTPPLRSSAPGHQAGEPAANQQNIDLIMQGCPINDGIDMRVFGKITELTGNPAILILAIGAHPLGPFCRVFFAEFGRIEAKFQIG